MLHTHITTFCLIINNNQTINIYLDIQNITNYVQITSFLTQ
jgi:hypothetical protein